MEPFITATGRPYFDLGLPTTKHERMLGSSILSYKNGIKKAELGRRMGINERKIRRMLPPNYPGLKMRFRFWDIAFAFR